jgi:hypothetical protein
MRGEGTFAAARREMADERASRSVTGLFEHKSKQRSFAPPDRWDTCRYASTAQTAVVASAFSFSD